MTSETTPSSTFCTNCGAALREGVSFCAACGHEVALTLAPGIVPPGSMYASVPGGAGDTKGMAITRFCAGCGAALRPGALFCAGCGRPVAAVSADAATPLGSPPLPSVPPASSPAFCPACGASLKNESQFCSSCGHSLSAAISPSSAPTPGAASAPIAQGQYSADGQWWWNGAQWQATQAAPTAPSRPRKAKRMVRRLTVWALVFIALTVANYFFWPQPTARALFVNFFASFAFLFTVWLVVLVAVRIIRGSRSKTWAGFALGVLLLEAVLSAGLNFNADAKTAATLPVLQSYYAEVADAVSLGNLVQANAAPAGITYATVKAQTDGVQNQMATLDVPAPLAAYAGAIDDWANTISNTAKYTVFWDDKVPYQPDPISLPMTTEGANAATAAAMKEIATLTAYDIYARKNSNKAGERFIGARLNAQAYWLQAVYTSSDPRWPSAQLRFLEPIDNYPLLQAVAAGAGLGPSGKTWPHPRHWADCSRNQHGFVACNIPQALTPLTVVWKADINPSNTYTTPTPNLIAAQKQFATIPPIDGSQGTPITGVGSGQDTTNAFPPAQFVSQCTAQGGHLGNPVYDRTVSRVPTSEGGWTCRTKNDRCFDLLTYSGSEYKGDGSALNNGSANCPQMGLKPTPLLANFGPKPTPPPPTPLPRAPSWDGTYTSLSSVMHCSGTATTPDGKVTPISQDLPVTGTTFIVSGSVIQAGTPVSINAGGQAVQPLPITGSAGTSGSGRETLLFVHDASGGVHFTATITANVTQTSAAGVGKLACSGSFSGSRN
jgi:double zinc ribbon protein/zinc ribbon protein